MKPRSSNANQHPENPNNTEEMRDTQRMLVRAILMIVRGLMMYAHWANGRYRLGIDLWKQGRQE